MGLQEERHLLVVHVLQRLDELPGDLPCQQAVQPMRVHLEALQNGLLDVLHDDARAALVLEGIQQGDNIGMAQQLQHPHLPLHSLVHLSGRRCDIRCHHGGLVPSAHGASALLRYSYKELMST